jgi:hypothetical protein
MASDTPSSILGAINAPPPPLPPAVPNAPLPNVGLTDYLNHGPLGGVAAALPFTATHRDVAAVQNRLRGVVSSALSDPNYVPQVDLGQLFQYAPLGSGFWERLVDDRLSPEDLQMALPAGNFEANPALKDDVLRQLALRAATRQQANQGPPPDPRRFSPQGGLIPSPLDIGIGAAQGIGGALFGPNGIGAMAGAPGGSTPPAGAPVAPGSPTGSDLGGAPPQQSAYDANATYVQNQQQATSPWEYVKGTTAPGGGGNVGPPLLRDKATGKVFAAYQADDKGTTRWVPAGDWNDPDVVNLINQYGPSVGIDSATILQMNKDKQSIAHEGAQMALAQAQADRDSKLTDLQIRVQQGELDLKTATRQADIHLADYNAEAARIKVEQARLDLALAPLTQQLTKQQIARSQLEQDQMTQKFPYELQQLQEQTALAREQRLAAERQRTVAQANDQFARAVYPGLIGALAVRGPTPPPQYAQAAQGAGVSPDDPAAQMAWATLQQQMAGAAAPVGGA